MSNYLVHFEKTITMASGTQQCSFDPRDFIHCNSEGELRYEIHDAFYTDDMYSEGDIRVYESSTQINIPQAFIDEWEKLKNNI